MIKKLVFTACFFLLAIAGIQAQDIPEKPSEFRAVNDYAGILDGRAGMIEAKLRAYNDSTSTQIVVVTVESLKGYDVADFSYRLAESWGIGQKGKNNGLLILVAPNERKMRIEVGYGLEAFVPDAKAKWIIDNLMKPAFKQGDYAGGIDAAINEIMNKASGAYKRDGTETDIKSLKKGTNWVTWVVLIIIILYIIFRRRGPGGYTSYSSGGFYGGSGSFGGSSGGSSFSDFGGGSFGGGGSSGDW